MQICILYVIHLSRAVFKIQYCTWGDKQFTFASPSSQNFHSSPSPHPESLRGRKMYQMLQILLPFILNIGTKKNNHCPSPQVPNGPCYFFLVGLEMIFAQNMEPESCKKFWVYMLTILQKKQSYWLVYTEKFFFHEDATGCLLLKANLFVLCF